jgi:HSP20 family protein
MSLSQRLFSEAFRDMQRAMSVFEQPLFNQMGPMLGSRTSSNLRSYPATDMIEKPDAYELQAELPGFNKNNIKIELADSRTLVLSGTVQEQHQAGSPNYTSGTEQDAGKAEASTIDEGSNTTDENRVVAKKENENQITKHQQQHQYWVNERVSSSFSRAFQFPTPIKAEDIKAQFDNGVLKVIVPKSVQDQPKQINIE